MAWNGSDQGKVERRGQGQEKSGKCHHSTLNTPRSSLKHGIIGGLVVVLGCSAVWWFVGRGGDNQPPTTNKPTTIRTIAEVEPQIATNRTVEAVAMPTEKPKKTLLQRLRERYGDNIPDNLKQTVYYMENPPTRSSRVLPTRGSIFRHPSERLIADIALTEPGTLFIIQPEFDASFDRDFVNAMLDKIEINDDDTEDQKALKEDVSAVKEELMRLCKEQGRQPSEIMNDHAKTLYELGNFRRNLEEELNAVHDKADYTDKDVEDFYAAANAMLKEKGLPELVSPDLTKRSIRLARRERVAAKRAANEKASKEKGTK